MSIGSGLGPNEVSALYEKCRSEERLVSPNWAYAIRDVFVQGKTFEPKIFGSSPEVLSPEEKYVWLLYLLKLAKSREQIWRVLANWLQCEGIRAPKDWLPESVFQQLTKQNKKELNKLRWLDLYYSKLVRIWLPYVRAFLREIKAFRALNPSQRRRLQNLGFDETLITAAIASKRRRSEISLTCEWLAQRGVVQPTKRRPDPDPARTLQEAYYRLFPSRSRSV